MKIVLVLAICALNFSCGDEALFVRTPNKLNVIEIKQQPISAMKNENLNGMNSNRSINNQNHISMKGHQTVLK